MPEQRLAGGRKLSALVSNYVAPHWFRTIRLVPHWFRTTNTFDNNVTKKKGCISGFALVDFAFKLILVGNSNFSRKPSVSDLSNWLMRKHGT